jgi:hypothetical protein
MGAIVSVMVVALVAACSGQQEDTCDTAEVEMESCDQAYYGDENCEEITQDCSDDDLIAHDALYQCIGNDCGCLEGPCDCDIDAGRISSECLEGLGL